MNSIKKTQIFVFAGMFISILGLMNSGYVFSMDQDLLAAAGDDNDDAERVERRRVRRERRQARAAAAVAGNQANGRAAAGQQQAQQGAGRCSKRYIGGVVCAATGATLLAMLGVGLYCDGQALPVGDTTPFLVFLTSLGFGGAGYRLLK